MKLLRVQVPDFRVLKNVDISFEKDFVPNIFPLGSQNGGGKSTLLQLIFILLHCSGDSERHEFIKNLLYGFDIDDNSDKRVLAIIDIWDGEKVVNLEFIIHRDYTAKQLLKSNEKLFINNLIYDDKTLDYIHFSSPNKLKNLNKEIDYLQSNTNKLTSILNQLNNISIIEDTWERERYLRGIEQNFRGLNILNFSRQTDFKSPTVPEVMKDVARRKILEWNSTLERLLQEREIREKAVPKLLELMHSNKITYICNYSYSKENNEDNVLLCHVNNLEIDIIEIFLTDLSKKIFLAAPTTQVFLFLPQNAIKMLFQQHKDNYQSQITNAKLKLPGLFPYNFFAVNLLINIFKQARDKDFKEAIETGEYGDSYKQLVNDLNLILLNKKINITTDLSGFTFKLNTDNRDTELSPADLSHGELKRLSIYAWLKYNVIDDGIVLIDEIENGFHPDWQYQIIKDISEWSPNNQYIIATHSYELCQAVTPAHVKELEPRLNKQESES